MLNFIPMEQVLTDFQCQRVRDINRKVGPIELPRLRSLVEKVALYQGRELSLPKDGYRSLFEPSMLDEPLKKFLAEKRFTPSKHRLTAAVSRVRSKLKGMGVVKPVSLEVAASALLQAKEENFAGLPTMGTKGNDFPAALARAGACWRGKCPPPVVIGHRGKSTVEARAVWMFPFEWHIVEGAYFIPLQMKFKRNVRIYAASNAVARRAKFREIATSGAYQAKLAMDYSKFDASIGTQLIGIAFGLLEEHLQLDSEQKKVWSRIATYFATCPFVDPHGRVVSGRRGGVPSGSMFTQMIDSIVNAIVIEYSLADVDKAYFVYGDDSVTYVKRTVPEMQRALNDVKRCASELGVTVNLSKTHVCEPTATTTFLGHYDLKSGRPEEDVLTRLIFPERPFRVDAVSLKQRVVSYMAESDEVLGLLMPVYEILSRIGDSKEIRADVESFARNYASRITTVEAGMNHPRNYPGLVQYLINEDPSLASAYFRIRAAV